jgi:uracil-DNA glycosylase family 4
MQPKAPHALCDKCPFKDRDFAATTGPKDADIAVVSRSPGYYESLAGKSFAGPSGKVLDHLLKIHGVVRDDIITTNVVLCQSDGDEEGFGIAQACCAPRLDHEIAEAKTVVACGTEAVRGLTAAGGIASNRGYVHYRDPSQNGGEATQRVIVTNNPAIVLRDDRVFPELVRDFKLALDPLPTPELPKVKWTEDIDEAAKWASDIYDQLRESSGTLLSVDIEGGYPNLACIGFSLRSERAVTIGIDPCKEEDFRREYLDRILTLPNVRYLWQFGKYDTKVLRRFGVQARVDEDTGLLSYALDERPGDPESGAGGHSLEWLLKDELGWPKYEPSSVKDFKKEKKTGVWANWPEEVAPKRERIELYEYNGMDTAGTLALYQVLKHRAIADEVFDKPYRSQLLPLNEALTQVELYGNIWDADAALNILEEEVWPKLDDWRDALRTISRLPKLNPNSWKQLEELMYETWGIEHDLDRPKYERKGKRSTDKSVREVILRGDYRSANTNDRNGIEAFIKTLDLWKELDKQRGTYLEGLTLKRSADGRIYTDFKIHGTESGRLSSANPNMQNITRPKEGLPNIRRVFVADAGCQFVSADLSQAELRTIAVLSGDSELRAIYLDTSRSLHKEIAEQFYGEDYTYEEYVKAKNINFGVAYGQSAYTFHQMYNMPKQEAQDFIDFWWERFPEVKAWRVRVEEQMNEVGEFQSPFGHKRRFYVIPQDKKAYIHAVNQAVSFMPQNIAANITLYALIQLVDELQPIWEQAQIRITVHDSIVACAREQYIDKVSQAMKDALERAAKDAIDWDFPYLADISVGPTWGDLKEIE